MTTDQFDTDSDADPIARGATPLADGDVAVIAADDSDRATGSMHRPGDAHLSPAEVDRLRTLFNDGTLESETSRIKWFLLGFLAALLSLVIAAIAFLAVSDDDNDGDVDVNVPTLDVDLDG